MAQISPSAPLGWENHDGIGTTALQKRHLHDLQFVQFFSPELRQLRQLQFAKLANFANRTDTLTQ
jgi:hypothetical protein